MEEQIIKLFGQNINSTRFTWAKYCGKLDVSTLEIIDPDRKVLINPNYKPIGWCKSNNLQIRPKDNGIAVMFVWNYDGTEVWCHFDDYYLRLIFNLIGQRTYV